MPAKTPTKKVARKSAKPTARTSSKPAPPSQSPERTRLPSPDRAVIAALDELFGGRADLRRGAMFGCPGYFLGTKAVACVFGDEMCLTLPPARIDELLPHDGYRPFVAARGRAMRGWVLLDQERIDALTSDDELLQAAVEHARSKAQKPARSGTKSRARSGS